MDNVVCIEFFGLPATWKTTLLKKMIKENPEKYISENEISKINKYFYWKNFFKLLPIAYVLIKYIIKFRNFSLNKEFFMILSFYNRYYYTLKKKKIFLLDHWFIQNFIDPSRSLNSKLMNIEIFKNQNLKLEWYHFYYIENDIERCINRELTRNTLKKLYHYNIHFFYKESESLLKYILSSNLIDIYEIKKNR